MPTAPSTTDDVIDLLEHVASYGVPPPGAAKVLDVGSDSFIRYFREEVLRQFIAIGGSSCRIFEGSYGSGKSHILQLLGNVALEEQMLVAHIDLSQALKLEEWKQITAHVLQEVSYVEASTVRSFPGILKARAGIVGPEELLKGRLPHAGFAKAATYALEASTPRDAWEHLRRYLLGEKVSTTLLRSYGFPGVKEPLNERNAEQILQTACMIHRRLGFRGTVLLFDENEKVFERSSARVIKSANLLRRLIDASASGRLESTLFVFAVLPDFLSTCSRVYPALGQRLETPHRDLDSAWRWPVLGLEEISTASEPEQFLDSLVARLQEIISCFEPQLELRQNLHAAGREVLASHAGTGFRRPLLKRLATTVLEQIHD